MYSAFAPLDSDEPLPRELVMDARRYRSWGRPEVAGLLWIPALACTLFLVTWAGGSGKSAAAAVAALLGAMLLFARSGRRA